jgi:peptide/nickel transport system substrate-binding protein
MHSRSLRTAVAIATVSALATTLAACGPGEPDEPSTLDVGVTSLSGTYAPTGQVGTDTSAVYETLLSFDYGTLEFSPLLATSYELSEDRLTASFVLRDDVDFTDGEHFDAEAAATALTAVVDSMTETGIWVSYADYEVQFEATGEYELAITTALPMAPFGGNIFKQIMFLPIFSPAHVDDLEALATAPVGTGPYLLDELVPDVSASFVRNEDYWNLDAAPFDSVELTVYVDEVAGLNALKSGQIDAVTVSTAVAADVETNGFRINEGPLAHTGLWIADRGGSILPAVADLRVREAIEYAFDREAINVALNDGYGVITSQPFTSGTPEYVEGGDDRYGYDPEKARDLMAEAGYADGFDLVIPSTTFLGINTLEPIVTQYLGDIGIRVTYETFADAGAFFTAALAGTYPVLLFPSGGDSALDALFLPDAVLAFHAYSDPILDELVATVDTGSLEESYEATSEIGEYVLDQAWYTVMSAPSIMWASEQRIEVTGGGTFIRQFQLAG